MEGENPGVPRLRSDAIVEALAAGDFFWIDCRHCSKVPSVRLSTSNPRAPQHATIARLRSHIHLASRPLSKQTESQRCSFLSAFGGATASPSSVATAVATAATRKSRRHQDRNHNESLTLPPPHTAAMSALISSSVRSGCGL